MRTPLLAAAMIAVAPFSLRAQPASTPLAAQSAPAESPEQAIQEDLRRLKQLLETGEIPTSSVSSRSPQPAGHGESRAAGGRR